MIDIIYKTVKPQHLEKLHIIQNINNLMFLIKNNTNNLKKNHSFLYPFLLLRETDFPKNSAWSFDWGTGVLVKMPRFNAFSRNVNAINFKIFLTHGGIYKLEKTQ